MHALTQLTKKDLLKRAKEHYFSLGVQDGASKISKSNFCYGLAKIQIAQERLGMEPHACFISTPDETISRNENRWNHGYGYGGKLSWGTPNDPLIFIDAKPNVCGMIVGALEELPAPEKLIKNVHKCLEKDMYIDDVKVQWDFKKGNHFIDIFKSHPVNERFASIPKYMFIIHGSAPELREITPKGVGLYWDSSQALRDMMKIMETPFGKVFYLDGDSAREYFRSHEFAKYFARKKRRTIAKSLFGNFTEIANVMHQGLLNYGEMVIGAQCIQENKNNIFPVALRSDLPAYLYSVSRSLQDSIIEKSGFSFFAKKHGLMKHLKNFNCIPHGGGYSFPHILRVLKVKEIGGTRFFVCEQRHEEAVTIFSDVRETEYTYRGKEVIDKMQNYKLGKLEVKLYPRYIVKI